MKHFFEYLDALPNRWTQIFFSFHLKSDYKDAW